MGVRTLPGNAVQHAAFQVNLAGLFRAGAYRIRAGKICIVPPVFRRKPDTSLFPIPQPEKQNSTAGGLLQTALVMPGSLEVELLFQQGEEGPGITHHPDRLHGSPVHQLGQG